MPDDKAISDPQLPPLDISSLPKFLNKLLFFGSDSLYVQDIPSAILKDIHDFTQAFPDRNTKVSVLTSKNTIVYLIGINKCNEQCQNEVAEIVQYVKPKAILIELCANRACGCEQHKNNIFQKPQKLTCQHLQSLITEIGFLPAFLYYATLYREKYAHDNLWLECKEQLIKSLVDAKENMQCDIILGDRPIDETLKREVKLLKYWDKAKLVSQITLGLLLRPLRKQFILSASNVLMKNGKQKNILVLERDVYLTYTLQTVARRPDNKIYKVIAIISDGHVKGIQTFWGKVTAEAINEMMNSDP